MNMHQNRCRSLPHDVERNAPAKVKDFDERLMQGSPVDKRFFKKERTGKLILSYVSFPAHDNFFFFKYFLVPTVSARIMSPMGFSVNRQAKHLAQVMESSLNEDEWDFPPSVVRPVPIWLCVFLVISYILGGAYLFSEWENWRFTYTHIINVQI